MEVFMNQAKDEIKKILEKYNFLHIDARGQLSILIPLSGAVQVEENHKLNNNRVLYMFTDNTCQSDAAYKTFIRGNNAHKSFDTRFAALKEELRVLQQRYQNKTDEHKKIKKIITTLDQQNQKAQEFILECSQNRQGQAAQPSYYTAIKNDLVDTNRNSQIFAAAAEFHVEAPDHARYLAFPNALAIISADNEREKFVSEDTFNTFGATFAGYAPHIANMIINLVTAEQNKMVGKITSTTDLITASFDKFVNEQPKKYNNLFNEINKHKEIDPQPPGAVAAITDLCQTILAIMRTQLPGQVVDLDDNLCTQNGAGKDRLSIADLILLQNHNGVLTTEAELKENIIYAFKGGAEGNNIMHHFKIDFNNDLPITNFSSLCYNLKDCKDTNDFHLFKIQVFLYMLFISLREKDYNEAVNFLMQLRCTDDPILTLLTNYDNFKTTMGLDNETCKKALQNTLFIVKAHDQAPHLDELKVLCAPKEISLPTQYAVINGNLSWSTTPITGCIYVNTPNKQKELLNENYEIFYNADHPGLDENGQEAIKAEKIAKFKIKKQVICAKLNSYKFTLMDSLHPIIAMIFGQLPIDDVTLEQILKCVIDALNQSALNPAIFEEIIIEESIENKDQLAVLQNKLKTLETLDIKIEDYKVSFLFFLNEHRACIDKFEINDNNKLNLFYCIAEQFNKQLRYIEIIDQICKTPILSRHFPLKFNIDDLSTLSASGYINGQNSRNNIKDISRKIEKEAFDLNNIFFRDTNFSWLDWCYEIYSNNKTISLTEYIKFVILISHCFLPENVCFLKTFLCLNFGNNIEKNKEIITNFFKQQESIFNKTCIDENTGDYFEYQYLPSKDYFIAEYEKQIKDRTWNLLSDKIYTPKAIQFRNKLCNILENHNLAGNEIIDNNSAALSKICYGQVKLGNFAPALNFIDEINKLINLYGVDLIKDNLSKIFTELAENFEKSVNINNSSSSSSSKYTILSKIDDLPVKLGIISKKHIDLQNKGFNKEQIEKLLKLYNEAKKTGRDLAFDAIIECYNHKDYEKYGFMELNIEDIIEYKNNGSIKKLDELAFADVYEKWSIIIQGALANTLVLDSDIKSFINNHLQYLLVQNRHFKPDVEPTDVEPTAKIANETKDFTDALINGFRDFNNADSECKRDNKFRISLFNKAKAQPEIRNEDKVVADANKMMPEQLDCIQTSSETQPIYHLSIKNNFFAPKEAQLVMEMNGTDKIEMIEMIDTTYATEKRQELIALICKNITTDLAEISKISNSLLYIVDYNAALGICDKLLININNKLADYKDYGNTFLDLTLQRENFYKLYKELQNASNNIPFIIDLIKRNDHEFSASESYKDFNNIQAYKEDIQEHKQILTEPAVYNTNNTFNTICVDKLKKGIREYIFSIEKGTGLTATPKQKGISRFHAQKSQIPAQENNKENKNERKLYALQVAIEVLRGLKKPPAVIRLKVKEDLEMRNFIHAAIVQLGHTLWGDFCADHVQCSILKNNKAPGAMNHNIDFSPFFADAKLLLQQISSADQIDQERSDQLNALVAKLARAEENPMNPFFCK